MTESFEEEFYAARGAVDAWIDAIAENYGDDSETFMARAMLSLSTTVDPVKAAAAYLTMYHMERKVNGGLFRD